MIALTPYLESDLPITGGRAYHLGIGAEDLSPSIILVGDPERVDMIAADHLAHTEVRASHRGLTTITGVARDTQQRITITTSGMGAPSTEIVLNEIMALSEVDTQTRTRKGAPSSLTIIRVGTSGALQERTRLGTSIISSCAVGLDSTAWFYAEGMSSDQTCCDLAQSVKTLVDARIPQGHPASGKLLPYGASSNGMVTEALRRAAERLGVAHEIGATVTASGFFAPQGRDVGRIPPSVLDFDRVVAQEPRLLNIDMETAFVLHFCGGHGFRAGAICVAAANRASNIFAHNVNAHIRDAARVAINALGALRSEP
jgi:uridine phosphorylase